MNIFTTSEIKPFNSLKLCWSSVHVLAKFVVVLATFVGLQPIYAQSLEWQQTVNPPVPNFASASYGNERAGRLLKIDTLGNTYVSGSVLGLFERRANTFISKVSASGVTIWSTILPGSDGYPVEIVVDGQNNLYVVGKYQAYGVSIYGEYFIRVVKLNGMTGQVSWSTNIALENAVGIAVDNASNVFIVGNNGFNESSKIKAFKYSGSTGSLIWEVTRASESGFHNKAYAVSIDNSNNLVVVGSHVFVAPVSTRALTIKFDGQTGAEVWSSLIPATGAVSATAIAIKVDGSGNVIVVGSSLSAGITTAFTAKINGASGVELWFSTFSAGGSLAEALSLAIDAAGNVVVAGYAMPAAPLDYWRNFATIKYNGSTGAQIWASLLDLQTFSNGPVGVSLDLAGNPIVTGSYSPANNNQSNFKTIKYDAVTGAELWNKNFVGRFQQADFSYGVAADGNGDAIIYGDEGMPRFGSVPVLVKLSGANGSELWVNRQSSLEQPVGMVAVAKRTLVLDKNGDVVVIGMREGAGSGIAPHTRNRGPISGADITTTKLSASSGNTLWSSAFNSSGDTTGVLTDDVSTGVAVTSDNGVVVVGTSSLLSGLNTIRVIKQDGGSGSLLWSITGPIVPYNSVASDVVADANGNVYVAGTTGDGLSSLNKIWVAKYNGINGQQIWSAEYVGAAGAYFSALRLNAQGNVVVVGYSGRETTSSLGVMRILKFSGSTGSVLWNTEFPSEDVNGSARAVSLAFDALDNVFVAGWTGHSTGHQTRVIKFGGASGSLLWAQTFLDNFAAHEMQVIEVDRAGDVFFSAAGSLLKLNGISGAFLWPTPPTGLTTSSISFDKLGNPVIVGYQNSMRVTKFNTASGVTIWSRRYDPLGESTISRSVVVSGNDIFIAGKLGPLSTQPSIVVMKIQDDVGAMDDLNGDGRADILTRDATGLLTARLMNGTTVTTTATLLAAGPNWTVTHTGDFNGDGRTDLVFRNSTDGSVVIYLMNGTAVQSSATMLAGGSPWVVAHVADFDGDGKADILWRNSSDNSHAIWRMDDLTILAGSGGIVNAGPWLADQIGDFNGDGKADILWRNSTDGSHAIWLMNGTAVLAGSGGILGAGPWVASHVADFNGDGKADILWRNTTDGGTVAMWTMNGITVTGGGTIIGAGVWQATHVGDLDGDGKADILWRNTSDGTIAAWLMNGQTVTSGTSLIGANSGWTVQKLLDLNGDGKADIVWRNTDGTIAVWLMNGLSLTSGATIVGPGTTAQVVP